MLLALPGNPYGVARTTHGPLHAASFGLTLSHHQALYRIEAPMTAFDWHSGEIDRSTPITASYRGTQKVRRFFRTQCGEDFHFDRPFMAWMKAAVGKTMGEAADEWLRRRAAEK